MMSGSGRQPSQDMAWELTRRAQCAQGAPVLGESMVPLAVALRSPCPRHCCRCQTAAGRKMPTLIDVTATASPKPDQTDQAEMGELSN